MRNTKGDFMNKKRRLFPMLMLAVVLALSSFALAACNGAPKPPVDVALSEAQVKDVISKIKRDKNIKAILRNEQGDDIVGVYYANENDSPVFYRGADNEDGSAREYYGRVGEQYYKINVLKDPNGVALTASYQLTQNDFAMNKENCAESELIEYSDIAKTIAQMQDMTSGGGELTESYSGTKYAGGNYEIVYTGVAQSEGTIKLTAKLDKELRVTQKSVEPISDPRFQSDAKDPYDDENWTVDITYGEVITMPAIENEQTNEKKVTLNFQTNATMPASFETSVDSGSKVTLPAPTNTGIDFLGWFYDKELKFPVKNNSLEVIYVGTTMSIYPKWSILPTLELDGGTLSEYYTSQLGYSFLISDYTNFNPDKKGFSFEGWYKDAGFTDKISDNDKEFFEVGAKLYAKFSPQIEITWITNGMSYELPKQHVNIGNRIYAPSAQDLSLRNKILEGWYKDAAFTTPLVNGETVASVNTTYYAKFVDAFTIDIKMPTGYKYTGSIPKYFTASKDNSDFSVISNFLSRFSGSIPDVAGKQFAYWATDAAGTTEFNSYPTANITIYAHYET